MPRNRIIKPDFWADEKICKISPLARLLFIGIWNFCDDIGVCRASAGFLRSQIFQHDDIDTKKVSSLISELNKNNRIKIVEFNGESFLWVNNFSKHQKIDKPSKFRFIQIEGDHNILNLFISTTTPRRLDDDSVMNVKDNVNEKENVLSDKPDQLVLNVVNYLNERLGTNYKTSSKKTIDLIKARNHQGFELEDFKTVINNQKRAWEGDNHMAKYLRPETLFSPKFESYLNAINPSELKNKVADEFNAKYAFEKDEVF